MSFWTQASRVRDEERSIGDRLVALKGCVSRFHPFGYETTLRYLGDAVGAEDGQWSSAQLTAAVVMLEDCRADEQMHRLAWEVRRCDEKAAGRRQPSPWELAELESKSWLTWNDPRQVRESRLPEGRDPAPSIGNGVPIPFRQAQRADFEAVLAMLPESRLPWTRSFEVRVYDDVLAIPVRIYNEELPSATLDALPPHQQTIVHCLYTRHHDGFVRQRHLGSVVASEFPWVVPYVVQVVGEYVVEIVNDVLAGLQDLAVSGSWQRRLYGRFIRDNPVFLELTRQRVESYWREYYWNSYSRPSARRPASGATGGRPIYPGFLVLDALRSAARDIDRLTVSPLSKVNAPGQP